MSYAVVWHPNAEAALTRIWLGARDRQRVSEAAERINQRLQVNPLGAGESREEDFRVVFDAPILVEFQVIESEQLVQELFVRRTKR